MQWNKIIYALIIVLLYIPLVFMGANVFFPEYDDYYKEFRTTCNKPYPADLTEPARAAVNQEQQDCYAEEEEKRQVYEREKRLYDGNKYIFVTAINLVALLAAIFISMETSVMMGLFLGSTIATFFSTWIYFDTKSRIGFGILVLIFISSVYFINKTRSVLFKKKK